MIDPSLLYVYAYAHDGKIHKYQVGDGIEIRVLRVGRDGVRLGVTAAPDVPVHRLEIYDQIRAANASAAADPGAAQDLARRLRGAAASSSRRNEP